MKTTLPTLHILLAGAAILLTASASHAHDYGVSSHSAGRGTVYTDNRGGSAYVGPRGAAAQGADGRSAAVTDRGAAYSGPNVTAVSDRYGAAAVGDNGAAYVNRSGAAYYGGSGAAVVATSPAVMPLPTGYIASVPAGCQTTYYGGYNCYSVNGIWYRPIFYGGTTVYVVVP